MAQGTPQEVRNNPQVIEGISGQGQLNGHVIVFNQI
ncbi:MAG: hypothetical protein SFH39_14700 [Candidatus Magnetobacterium sp. LHC-1]